MIGALKLVEAGRKVEDVAREVGVSKYALYASKAKTAGRKCITELLKTSQRQKVCRANHLYRGAALTNLKLSYISRSLKSPFARLVDYRTSLFSR